MADVHAAQAELSQRSLAEYTRWAWPHLEPQDPFIPNWHIDCVCEHLEAITAGQITRLVINIPPGTMKSWTCSVAWPTWEWGPKNLPHMRYVTTSYNDGPVTRDMNKAKDLMLTDWYRANWPHVQLRYFSDHRQITSRTGSRIGSPFKSLTSKRGNRLIIDDPHSIETAESDKDRKRSVRLFREGAINRLSNQRRDAIVIIMQRLHFQDIAAVALEMGFQHLCLPMEFEPDRVCYTPVKRANVEAVRARYDSKLQRWYVKGQEIPPQRAQDMEATPLQTVYRQDPRTQLGEILHPERFPPTTVTELKRMGSYAWASQYQQRPTPREGGLFKQHYFAGKIVKDFPRGMVWVRHWDLAASRGGNGARSAGVKLGRAPDGRYFVGHVKTEREDGTTIRKTMLSIAEADGKDVYISVPQDPGQAGKAQSEDMIKTTFEGYRAHAEPESGDKFTRAEPFAVQCEIGNVFLVEGPWNQDYIDELCLFPGGALADQVDASSGAFTRLMALKAPLKVTNEMLRNIAAAGARR